MNPAPPVKAIGFGAALLYAAGAILSFTLAYDFTSCEFLIVFFFACLLPLTRLRTRRLAYYFGWGIGLAVYTPHLLFFWTTFGYGSIALWYILPFWLGIFLMLGRASLIRFGPLAWACLAPFLWTGLEFFRSELYYLRFSWLNAGYVFSNSSALHNLSAYGVYGIGFLFMSVAAVASLRGRPRLIGLALLLAAAFYPALRQTPSLSTQSLLRVAGVQMEFPGTPTVLSALNRAVAKFPDADLFVLSEYTFLGPVPGSVEAWCRKNRKFLVVGGEDPATPTGFYDTAFVVDTNGTIAFRQAKCVPVQFMADGRPARGQQLWNSPWGKIGLGICYDASYRRVTDEMIRQGAQALIFPTMDIVAWAESEHLLHGRVAPMRAAEFGVPVFRVCSSGISQFVDGSGRVQSSAPYPGDGAMLSAAIALPERGRLPPDHWLAWLSVGVVAVLVGWLSVEGIQKKLRNRTTPARFPIP